MYRENHNFSLNRQYQIIEIKRHDYQNIIIITRLKVVHIIREPN